MKIAKSIKFFVFFCLSLFLFGLMGCVKKPSDKNDLSNKTAVKKVENSDKILTDLSVAVTKGNHTYVPINIEGVQASKALLILEVLQRFEEEYQDLEVTSWAIEELRDSHNIANPYIYGLWINHKRKY